MPIEQPSPYRFDLKNAEPPPPDRGTGIKFQCLTVLFLLTTELASIWLRPIGIAIFRQYEFAANMAIELVGRISREEFTEVSARCELLRERTLYLVIIAFSCIGAQLLCYIPVVGSFFWTTSRKNLRFRYLALLATSVPLAIGVYHQELGTISPYLSHLSTMAYQYIVIAFTAHVLVVNGFVAWRKPIEILQILPMTFFVISSVQSSIASLSVMYLLAAIATIGFVSCVPAYARLCFWQRSGNVAGDAGSRHTAEW